MWNKIVLAAGCLLGASGVAMGAYQAHGLSAALERAGVEPQEAAKRIDNCGVAVRYQSMHALALLATGVAGLSARRRIVAAPILMLVGVLGFSGGLYMIVFSGESLHWAIVPSGGLAMIVGWLALLVELVRLPAKE